MKALKPLPEAEKMNYDPPAPEPGPELPEETPAKAGPEGWVFIGLIAAMLIGLAFQIKYVFGLCLSVLLIMVSLSKSVTTRTPMGSRPLKPKERVPIFIAGLVAAAFTILAHSSGRLAVMISTFLVIGIILILPLALLHTLISGSVKTFSELKKRRKSCSEPVTADFMGLTLRGTGLPPGIDPAYGENREYVYWYGGDEYRILLPCETKAGESLELTLDPEAPEKFYCQKLFSPIRKDAIEQFIVGIIFPSVVIALILFIAGMTILTNS